MPNYSSDQKLQDYTFNNPMTDGTESTLLVIQETLDKDVIYVLSDLNEIPAGTNYVEIQVQPLSEVVYTEDGETDPNNTTDPPTGWTVNGSDTPPYDRFSVQGLGVQWLRFTSGSDLADANVIIKFCHKETISRNFYK